MFQNYLKIAARNLLKHKAYSLINALGLFADMPDDSHRFASLTIQCKMRQ